MSEYKYGIIHVQERFTFMRVRIDEGVYIDMINLQTNSGIMSDDQIARRSNIQQVADFIQASSAGNAVIVFGDTNSRYTRYALPIPSPCIDSNSKNSRARENIRLFTIQNGLKDAWVQATGGDAPSAGTEAIVCPKGVPPNINCEVVDKVFYRGSPFIDLESSGFFYDTSRFVSPKKEPLVNHNPVQVEFKYVLKFKVDLRQSDLYGDPYGTWFNDLPWLSLSPKLSSITLRGANRLDGLTLTLASGLSMTHGGSGGSPKSLILAPGEYIASVTLCWGDKNGYIQIFYAQVETNSERHIQAGKMTNDCSTPTAPDGYGVVGTYGQSGQEMYQLGFIYALQLAE